MAHVALVVAALAVEKLPAAQPTQTAFPAAAQVPGPHTLQRNAPGPELEPGGQFEHTAEYVARGVALNVPATHGTQLTPRDAQLPSGHTVHPEPSLSEALPGEHGAQALALVAPGNALA